MTRGAQFLAVVEAAIAGGCDTQREVVERTGLSKASVTRAVQILERAGKLIRCGRQQAGTWSYETLWDVAVVEEQP